MFSSSLRLISAFHLYLSPSLYHRHLSHILKMPSAQGPPLQRIHRSEVDKIIQAIIDDGGVIIKNFATPEAVERVNEDTRPYLDADKPWKAGPPPHPTNLILLTK